MPKFICHHKGVYNIYTTVSDGFYWERGINEETLRAWYRDEYGRSGLETLGDRLSRARANGTSALDGMSIRDLVLFNRAGPNESTLTGDECVRQFFRHAEDRASHGEITS